MRANPHISNALAPLEEHNFTRSIAVFDQAIKPIVN
jgi:hypothetical protein